MLFKGGFGRWVVALMGCFVWSRFWQDSGQAGVCSNGSPHPMLAKKHCLHWEHAGTAWPFQKQGHSPCLSQSLHAPLWADKDKGVVPCWGETQRGANPHLCRAHVPWVRSCLLQKLLPGGKAMEGHSIHPSAPSSRRSFSQWEMSKLHPSPSPPEFWTQVFNEWRKTD